MELNRGVLRAKVGAVGFGAMGYGREPGGEGRELFFEIARFQFAFLDVCFADNTASIGRWDVR